MNQLQIMYVPIGELKPYAGNAKIHTEEQINQIMESIRQFGMNDPIAVWKDNEIIEGHGRLIACQRLGIETVPVISLDGLTDEQRRAYMNVHNQLTMNTGFDIDLLNAELFKIKNIDMTAFGFDIPQDDGQNASAEDDGYTEPDNLPSMTERGQIWLLGRHKLMVGDSTNPDDVRNLIRGGVGRFMHYRSALQCGLFRKDKSRHENRERQNGGWFLCRIPLGGFQKHS